MSHAARLLFGAGLALAEGTTGCGYEFDEKCQPPDNIEVCHIADGVGTTIRANIDLPDLGKYRGNTLVSLFVAGGMSEDIEQRGPAAHYSADAGAAREVELAIQTRADQPLTDVVVAVLPGDGSNDRSVCAWQRTHFSVDATKPEAAGTVEDPKPLLLCDGSESEIF